MHKPSALPITYHYIVVTFWIPVSLFFVTTSTFGHWVICVPLRRRGNTDRIKKGKWKEKRNEEQRFFQGWTDLRKNLKIILRHTLPKNSLILSKRPSFISLNTLFKRCVSRQLNWLTQFLESSSIEKEGKLWKNKKEKMERKTKCPPIREAEAVSQNAPNTPSRTSYLSMHPWRLTVLFASLDSLAPLH